MPEFSRAMDVSVFALRPWVRRYDGTPVDPALHIMTHWLRLVLASVLVPLAGCVVAPYPTAYPSTVSTSASVDRIWDAALGAAADAGIQISNADRGTGRITGSKAGAAVTIELSPQADGSQKVSFSATASKETNPTLGDRWLTAYDRRMGR